MEYNKNNYVVCFNTPVQNPQNKESHRYGGGGFKSNYCLKIREIDNNDGYLVLWFYDHENGVYDNNVRPANQQEIEHYNKIGKPYDITTVNFEITINNFEIW